MYIVTLLCEAVRLLQFVVKQVGCPVFLVICTSIVHEYLCSYIVLLCTSYVPQTRIPMFPPWAKTCPTQNVNWTDRESNNPTLRICALSVLLPTHTPERMDAVHTKCLPTALRPSHTRCSARLPNSPTAVAGSTGCIAQCSIAARARLTARNEHGSAPPSCSRVCRRRRCQCMHEVPCLTAPCCCCSPPARTPETGPRTDAGNSLHPQRLRPRRAGVAAFAHALPQQRLPLLRHHRRCSPVKHIGPAMNKISRSWIYTGRGLARATQSLSPSLSNALNAPSSMTYSRRSYQANSGKHMPLQPGCP